MKDTIRTPFHTTRQHIRTTCVWRLPYCSAFVRIYDNDDRHLGRPCKGFFDQWHGLGGEEPLIELFLYLQLSPNPCISPPAKAGGIPPCGNEEGGDEECF